MDTRRQQKIASVIKEVFSDILLRHGKNIYGSALVTVTKVKPTSDLGLVRFYLSIYNTANADEVLEKFEEKKFEIKKLLAEKLRHHLRIVPQIEFFKDDTLDYVQHIEEVFQKIKQEDELLKSEIATALKPKSETNSQKQIQKPKRKTGLQKKKLKT